MAKAEKNVLMGEVMSEQQLSPTLARPEDFVVRKYDDAISQPFHGQCGDSDREYAQLEKEAGQTSKGPITGKGAPRPVLVETPGNPFKAKIGKGVKAFASAKKKA